MSDKDTLEKAAEEYRDKDFENNPNGYTVSPYCNSETTTEAFMAGAQWQAEQLRECSIHGLFEKTKGYCPVCVQVSNDSSKITQWKQQAEALAVPLRGFVDYSGGFASDSVLGEETLKAFEEFKNRT